jgi:WD40 repeat protein
MKIVALGSTTGLLLVYDDQNEIQFIINAHTSAINRLVKSSNGLVATGSNDTFLKVWNANNRWSQVGNFTFVQATGVHMVNAVRFINDTTLIAGYSSGWLVIWSIGASTPLTHLNIGSNYGSGADSIVTALSPVIRSCLMAVGISYRIEMFDVCSSTVIMSFPNTHTKNVNDFELAQNGTTLISSSNDMSVIVWAMSINTAATTVSVTVRFTLTSHTDFVYGLKMISSSVLASASADNTIKLWNILSGTLNITLTGHTGPILYGLDFLDESTVVSGSLDTYLKTWHASGGPAFWWDTMSVQIQSLAIVYLQRERNFFFYFKAAIFTREDLLSTALFICPNHENIPQRMTEQF